MDSHSNPWVRFAVGLVAVAIAIQVVWQLIRPALPFIGGVLLVVVAVRVWLWWRDRY